MGRNIIIQLSGYAEAIMRTLSLCRKQLLSGVIVSAVLLLVLGALAVPPARAAEAVTITGQNSRAAALKSPIAFSVPCRVKRP
jgi:hypothetical protein